MGTLVVLQPVRAALMIVDAPLDRGDLRPVAASGRLAERDQLPRALEDAAHVLLERLER